MGIALGIPAYNCNFSKEILNKAHFRRKCLLLAQHLCFQFWPPSDQAKKQSEIWPVTVIWPRGTCTRPMSQVNSYRCYKRDDGRTANGQRRRKNDAVSSQSNTAMTKVIMVLLYALAHRRNIKYGALFSQPAKIDWVLESGRRTL
jgi:hypothetical protein